MLTAMYWFLHGIGLLWRSTFANLGERLLVQCLSAQFDQTGSERSTAADRAFGRPIEATRGAWSGAPVQMAWFNEDTAQVHTPRSMVIF